MSAPAPPEKGHRWFAATYDRFTRPAERTFMRPVRTEVAGGARGVVLEIGAGTGATFAHYTDLAERIVAIEPDPYMLRRAQAKLVTASRPIELRLAAAESLPFDDASFDSVVSILTLCSVRDLTQSLREIRRILRPGGQLRFYEHVRSSRWLNGFLQDVSLPVWRWCAAGCHCNRRTAEAIASAGLEVRDLVHTTPVPPIPPMLLVRPHVKGIAVRE